MKWTRTVRLNSSAVALGMLVEMSSLGCLVGNQTMSTFSSW